MPDISPDETKKLVESKQTFGDRLMVGLQVLVLAIGVRIPVSEHKYKSGL